MKNKSVKSFTSGKIFAPLLGFVLPVLFALCLQAMYGAVDLLVVGRYALTSDVSAVSTGSQIMQTVTFVIAALAVGTTVLIGQALGRGEGSGAGRVIGCSICLFMAIAVGVTIVMELVAVPFTALMQAPESAFSRTVSYVRICSAGSVFIVSYNLLGSIFRGIGDSKTPLMAVAVACVLNIAGDLLFVRVFGMGASGAALATVLSQAISVGICLLVLRVRGVPFDFSVKYIRFEGRVIAQILRLGGPVALQDALVSVSFLAILAIVNHISVTASAAIGVAEKICAFIMLIPSAFSQSLSAFVAQNFGAGEMRRCEKAMLYGMLTSLVFGVGAGLLSFFYGVPIASVFEPDSAEVARAAADYLSAYSIDAVLVSFLFCFGGYFNGVGKTTFSMIQGIIGAFCVRIPVSFIMSRVEPVSLFNVGLATPCSTVVQITICLIYFLVIRRQFLKTSRISVN